MNRNTCDRKIWRIFRSRSSCSKNTIYWYYYGFSSENHTGRR